MGKKFLYDEDLKIQVEIKVYYNSSRESFVFNGFILYKQCSLNLFVNMTRQTLFAQQKLSEAYHSPIKRSNYKVTKALIGQEKIELEKPDEEILFTKGLKANGRELVSMPLKRIMFTCEGETKANMYRMTSVCTPLLYNPFCFLIDDENHITGRRYTQLSDNCFNIPFTVSKSGNYAYIETDKIDILLLLFSFYYCTYIEYDMASYPCKDGKICIEIKTPQYKVMVNNPIPSRDFLFSNQKNLGSFTDFLYLTNECGDSLFHDELFSKYISYYVKAEYLDNVSKLIIYTTILEKMAMVKISDSTYDRIKNYLDNKKIDIRKIDSNVSKSKIKNEKGRTISNFVMLRNSFVHHLGSEKAEQFLRESDMLFYLKMCITILLLYRMGIKDVKFDQNFAHLSLFDECITAGEYAKAKTNKCRFCRWIRKMFCSFLLYWHKLTKTVF
jgi:hypothetical protein